MKSYLVYSMFFLLLVYVNLDLIACDIKKLNFHPRTGVRNCKVIRVDTRTTSYK